MGDRRWFQFHSGRNLSYARKMFKQARVAYDHHPTLSVRLLRWVRPNGAERLSGMTTGLMYEKRP